MNCLDCATGTRHVPAVAICHDCGAGICADHAHVDTNYLTRMVGLGMPVAVEPPDRIVRCNICADADAAIRSAAGYRGRKSRSAQESA